MTLRERIKELCKKNGVSLNKLEDELGFAKGYMSKLDKSTPNAVKIQKIADYFGVSVDYLMTGNEDSNNYYLNEDAREMAQFMFDNPEYKVLFDASRNVKKEDIELVKQLMDRFKQE